MFNVYIIDSADVPHGEDADIEREALQDCAALHLVRLFNESEFDPYAADTDAIILWHYLQIGRGLLSRLPKTRIIVRNGVGFDNIDVAAAAEFGIPVSNVPDYGTEEVADHAIMLSLALIRQLRVVTDDIRAGNWEWRTAVNCRRVRDQVFGVVGCGRIGTATALRAKALGLQTRFYDPYLPSGYEKAIGIARADSLEALLREADVVSLHVPLDAGTLHLMDTPQFDWMKKTAYLVNTSRGPVVRYDAVVEALASGKIAGAGLDVLEHEPKGGEIMMRFPNVIVTPHSAFYSQESLAEMRRKSALTVRQALLNGRFLNVVNQVTAGRNP
jgi:phosphoglycerate dehydrogenase-like enzyme